MEVITSGWNCGPGKSPFLPRSLCSHPVYHWMDLGSIWGPFCFAVWPGGPPLPLCAAPCNALSMGSCAATYLMPEHRCCLFNLRVPSHLMLLCLPSLQGLCTHEALSECLWMKWPQTESHCFIGRLHLLNGDGKRTDHGSSSSLLFSLFLSKEISCPYLFFF